MKLIAVAACLALTLGLAACTQSLDTGDVENEINSKLGLESASCPDDVDAEAGNSFTCTGDAPGGQQVEVEVNQLDDDGNIEMTVVGPADGGSGAEPAQ